MVKSKKENGSDRGKKGKIKAKLLDSSSSDSENDDQLTETGRKTDKNQQEFSINKGYAERYDNWRNLEEMQKLKSRLGVTDINELNDAESSSESSEDDEEWSPDKEKAFLKTLSYLKKKDPKIYNEEFGFFKGVEENEGGGTEDKSLEDNSKKSKEKKKPFTVRDHERVMVLEQGGQFSGDEDEGNKFKKSGQSLSYPEEQASIKTAFSKALKDIDSSDDEEADTLLGSKLLKKRTVKSDEENAREEEEYKLWLKGELDKVGRKKISKEDKKELTFLREYWNDDKLDEGEKFLRDYILNKNYIEPAKGDDDKYIPSYNEVVHDDDELSNDEKFEAEREEFEHKYNFRFEEPDQEFIKRYPRTVQDSLRREEHKRKEQREKAKERKEETVARKREEVQRLKALKRKEIMNKIQKLHEISGNPDLELTEMDIDGDFDPEEYDRRMQQLFNDDYYQEEADDQKPVFEYDKDIDDEENWAEWVPRGEEEIKQEPQSDEESDDEEEEVKVKTKSRMDLIKSTQQELIESVKGKRSRKKRSVFLDALEREKPKFDPKIHKSFDKYFEEYYKLDFEDLVGDLPCRFKYHKTTANDFGLSVNEILKAQDKELNQWASIKKTFQYRNQNEEEYEVQAYKKKAEQDGLKKRFLPSVYQATQAPEENPGEDGLANKPRKKKKKNKKSKQNAASTSDSSIAIKSESESPRKNKIVGKEEPSPLKSLKNESPRKFPTDDTPTVVASTSSDSPGKKLSKRQRKNLKQKLLAAGGGSTLKATTGDTAESNSSKNNQDEQSQRNGGSSKKDKKPDKQWKGTKRKASESSVNVDDDRIRAYGVNPKKLKKQMKYGATVAKL